MNNGSSLAWPATVSKDLDGQQLILDADADTHFTADTDDRLDLALAGTDLFRWDGTVATPVNGLDFIASAAASAVQITAVGSDTNISINLVPKGTGVLQNGGTTVIPATLEFFVPATQASDALGTTGDYPVAVLNAGTEVARMAFFVPNDFSSITNAVVITIPTSTQASADWDINTDFAAVGEDAQANSGSDTSTTYNVTNDQLFEVDVSGELSGLAANDYVGVTLTQTGSGHNVGVLGVRFRYTT